MRRSGSLWLVSCCVMQISAGLATPATAELYQLEKARSFTRFAEAAAQRGSAVGERVTPPTEPPGSPPAPPHRDPAAGVQQHPGEGKPSPEAPPEPGCRFDRKPLGLIV